ncbi:MAG: protoporphyrinogen oxidase, partial [Ottowia sp.]|nr:protoporphyrinogen oxidase [Ottowia sp.]
MTETANTADTIIVGAGISGLALASFLRRECADASVLVLEAGSTAGGAIRSFQGDGYLTEWAPHGFLDNGAESDELVDMAGLRGELLQAPLKEYVRYLCIDGRLQLVPQTPPKIMMAPLMGWGDKIGVVARDIFRPYFDGEPSVADWVRRRFGAAMLPFADAVYTGTYAGDIDELRIDGTMPALRALEKEHGSVIFSILARIREKRKNAAAENNASKKRGMPIMQNFRGGMERWPLALTESLQAAGVLHLSTSVQTVQREGEGESEGWLLHTTQGDYHCRELALALPINAALALLRASAGLPVPEIPVPGVAEARLANVALGFGPEAQIPFGFGYLTSKKEGRFALGALFSSHMFPGRTPEGGQLLEALVGGRRNPDYLDL